MDVYDRERCLNSILTRLTVKGADPIVDRIRSQIDELPIFKELTQGLAQCERVLGRIPELIDNENEPVGIYDDRRNDGALGAYSHSTGTTFISDFHIESSSLDILRSMMKLGLPASQATFLHEEVHRLQALARDGVCGPSNHRLAISLPVLALTLLPHCWSVANFKILGPVTLAALFLLINSVRQTNSLTIEPYTGFLQEMHAHIAKGTVCPPDWDDERPYERLNDGYVAYTLLNAKGYKDNTSELIERLDIDEEGFWHLVEIVHDQLIVMIATGMTHQEVAQVLVETKDSDITPTGVRTFARIVEDADIEPWKANQTLREKRTKLRFEIQGILLNEMRGM